MLPKTRRYFARHKTKHVDSAILKMKKAISVIKKLGHSLPQKSLLTIYRAFLRPLIDYGDINYDQPQNEPFHDKRIFFSIKLFNLHYTNKQRAYNIEIKNIYKRNCCM